MSSILGSRNHSKLKFCNQSLCNEATKLTPSSYHFTHTVIIKHRDLLWLQNSARELWPTFASSWIQPKMALLRNKKNTPHVSQYRRALEQRIVLRTQDHQTQIAGYSTSTDEASVDSNLSFSQFVLFLNVFGYGSRLCISAHAFWTKSEQYIVFHADQVVVSKDHIFTTTREIQAWFNSTYTQYLHLTLTLFTVTHRHARLGLVIGSQITHHNSTAGYILVSTQLIISSRCPRQAGQ